MTDIPRIRFGIVPTYRCNMACKDCNRNLDRFPWPDSDLSIENLRRGGQVVYDSGFGSDRIRFTGGEPLLHPDIVEIANIVKDEWKPKLRLVSFSNGTIEKPKGLNLRLNATTPDVKQHRPYLISPHDLGIKANGGWKGYCHTRFGCGTLFDCYGFSFCVLAGSIGRLLRIDPYKASLSEFCHCISHSGSTMQLMGMKEICKHCPCSIPVSRRFSMQDAAVRGDFEYPTKTYRKALAAFEKEPFIFTKFEDR